MRNQKRPTGRRLCSTALLAVLSLAGMSRPVMAQTAYGGLVGVVKDPRGPSALRDVTCSTGPNLKLTR